MSKQTSFEELGRFLGLIVSLFTMIKRTLSPKGVGLEIIPWLVGNGSKAFTEEFLEPLAERYLSTLMWVKVDANTLRVNLDAPPTLPCMGAKTHKTTVSGWAILHKRRDGIYLDGRRITRQKCQKVRSGFDIVDAVKNISPHSNVRDAMLANPEFIPADWTDADCKVYFFGLTFYKTDAYVNGIEIKSKAGEGSKYHRTSRILTNHCWEAHEIPLFAAVLEEV